MKTKGSFLSYIAAEKKQRKEEVKTSVNHNSFPEYSGAKSKNSLNRNDSVHYQMS